jgi:steroid delta-isomerase-like uncharacterized protein
MSTQGDNKRLMRRFTEEFWNRGNIAFADEIVAEDLIHDQLPPDWPQGREGFKRLVQTWRVAFPDLHEHLEFVLAEGDRALGRFRLTGTHSGPFYGIEPTGRSVDIHGVDVARIVDGKIVEYFYHEDTFGLFRQLGRFPANYSDVAGTIQDASVNA